MDVIEVPEVHLDPEENELIDQQQNRGNRRVGNVQNGNVKIFSPETVSN